MTDAPVALSPDGVRYLHMGAGERVARPFHYRWLMPRVFGDKPERWQQGLIPAFLLLFGGVWALTGRYEIAAFAFVLPGVHTIHTRFPVLVDIWGMVFAAWTAAAIVHGYWPVGIALALIAGATRETAPIWAAIWAWHPLGLIGLLAPAIRHLQKQGEDVLDAENAWIIKHPIRASRKYHKGIKPWVYILPWGGLVVGFAALDYYQVLVAVVVAYLSVCVATDTVRIYQWAWPVMGAASYMYVGAHWMFVLWLLTFANPFTADGV